MRIQSDDTGKQPAVPSSLPFPEPPDEPGPPSVTVGDRFGLAALPESAEAIFSAVDAMSRRIDDLARELRCLGYFDDDDDAPRAA